MTWLESRRVSPFGHLRLSRSYTPHRSFSQYNTSFFGTRYLGILCVPLVAFRIYHTKLPTLLACDFSYYLRVDYSTVKTHRAVTRRLVNCAPYSTGQYDPCQDFLSAPFGDREYSGFGDSRHELRDGSFDPKHSIIGERPASNLLCQSAFGCRVAFVQIRNRKTDSRNARIRSFQRNRMSAVSRSML